MTLYINIGVLVYFIYQQFNFGIVNRFKYLALPVFALYKLATIPGWQWSDVPWAILIAAIGLMISWYQAKGTKVREEHLAKYYFRNKDNDEVPVYTHAVTAKGGTAYLSGWVIIIIVEFGLEVVFSQLTLNNLNLYHLVVNEALETIATAYAMANPGHGSWSVWSLTFFTSAGYTLWLMRKSSLVKDTLLNREPFEIVDED
ncbi:hypothetical protein AYR62_13510 [Secundilactobacillus paracollinoides]|uniref:hypothetical protein n=1 Tax=Secundilactobacillus paracollinoides TaxID=240427 RepID=UPI00081A6302|nr:hypothetical protein [Secundilactobacillus paracollinoides]ANZ64994.1 hypothetical protein AYR62_13510 [Secundilactobacillus paracollinoides]